MVFQEKLAKIMELREITNPELARILGTHSSTVRMWFVEGSYPSSKYLPKIAEVLNTYIDYLFSNVMPESPADIPSPNSLVIKTVYAPPFKVLDDKNLDNIPNSQIHNVKQDMVSYINQELANMDLYRVADVLDYIRQ